MYRLVYREHLYFVQDSFSERKNDNFSSIYELPHDYYNFLVIDTLHFRIMSL